MPDLADQGIYVGSERSFYLILHASGQLRHRGRQKGQVMDLAFPLLSG